MWWNYLSVNTDYKHHSNVTLEMDLSKSGCTRDYPLIKQSKFTTDCLLYRKYWPHFFDFCSSILQIANTSLVSYGQTIVLHI